MEIYSIRLRMFTFVLVTSFVRCCVKHVISPLLLCLRLSKPVKCRRGFCVFKAIVACNGQIEGLYNLTSEDLLDALTT